MKSRILDMSLVTDMPGLPGTSVTIATAPFARKYSRSHTIVGLLTPRGRAIRSLYVSSCFLLAAQQASNERCKLARFRLAGRQVV